MSRFTPLFTKDGDTYIVPSPSLSFESSDLAVAGGAAAGLTAGYGLTPTGEAVELPEDSNTYPGPFLIAAIGNLRAWIVGGPSLDSLVQTRSEGVENLPGTETGGDHTGPDRIPVDPSAVAI